MASGGGDDGDCRCIMAALKMRNRVVFDPCATWSASWLMAALRLAWKIASSKLIPVLVSMAPLLAWAIRASSELPEALIMAAEHAPQGWAHMSSA